MKKVFALALAAMMALCAAGALASCGGTPLSQLTPDSYGNLSLQSGRYYVDEDMTLNGRILLSGDIDVTLCLHGNTLAVNQIWIEGSKLTLDDCMGDGSVTSTGWECLYNDGGDILIKDGAVVGSVCGVHNEGNLIVDGGTVEGGQRGVENSGGTFTMLSGAVIAPYDGVINASGSLFKLKSGDVVGGSVSIMNEAGGEVEMSGGATRALDESPAHTGVQNRGTFRMTDGDLRGSEGGVQNRGTFELTGGEVRATGEDSIGVVNDGLFRMNGDDALVAGGMTGVLNIPPFTFTIVSGRIEGVPPAGNPMQCAVFCMDESGEPIAPEATEMQFIAQGSAVKEGGFGEQFVVVTCVGDPVALPGEDAAGAAGDLPKTGDPSMLGAWALLLGASAMGLNRCRKK